MVKLSLVEILKKIENEEIFHAVLDDYSLEVKIDDYVPYVAVAIGGGNQFSKKLSKKHKLVARKRVNHVDTCTGDFIYDLPITLIARDSKFEYDLDMHVKDSIRADLESKPLWKEELTSAEKIEAQRKHQQFYRIILSLMIKLEELFGATIYYDFRAIKTSKDIIFNIDTSQISLPNFQTTVDQWEEILNNMQVLDFNVRSMQSQEPLGTGYFSQYVHANSLNALVLPTYISKIYYDQNADIIYPEVVQNLRSSFKYYVKAHAHRYYDSHQESIDWD